MTRRSSTSKPPQSAPATTGSTPSKADSAMGSAEERLDPGDAMDRRRFLRQVATVGTLSAGSAYVSLAPPSWPGSLSDPDGEVSKPLSPIYRLPEGGFQLANADAATDLAIAHGQAPRTLVHGAVDALGGMRRFIERGDVVVLKPNVAFGRSAPLGATTHPEVLKAVIELVRGAGAAEVRVVDNPIESPESCFERTGIRKAALEAGARVYLPQESAFEQLHTHGATLIEHWPFFWRPFIGANKVIGLAPVKDHNLCGASMTTKNWYGLLGGRRNQFHQNIHEIIADLALMMRPSLVILDGIRVLFRSGPTGGSLSDVRPGHTVVASTDSVAADAYGWEKLLQRPTAELPDYFSRCQSRGLGTIDWRSVRHKELQL